MAALSKLHCSCYELGHCWTPSCTQATFDVAVHGFIASFKIYAALYLITSLLRRRKKGDYLKKVLPDILRSTLFLGTNAFTFMAAFCIWRKYVGFYFFYNVFACGIPGSAIAISIEKKNRRLLGCFYFLSISYIPSLYGSSFAILLERKSRRSLLAVYMMNVAMETVYRMAKSRGLVRNIPHGEVLLFSVVSAIYMFLFRTQNGLKNDISSFIKLLVGRQELPPSGTSGNQNTTTPLQKKLELYGDYLIPASIKGLLNQLRHNLSKHFLCNHQYSCASYCLEGAGRCFGVGVVIQVALQFLKSLPTIFKQPRVALSRIFNRSSLSLGAFLGGFTGMFRLVNCLLRWLRNKDERLHGAVAGFIAGWSMMFYKSVTIPVWLTSKLCEVLYFKGIDAGKFPYLKHADTLVYTICTSLVFHAAVFEPHNLRPAYWSFLQKITDDKFGKMNRTLIDCYGTQASKMFPGYKPVYDPRFTDL